MSSKKSKRRAGRPSLEMIEAAGHLLRNAPAGALLSYYIGSIPCVLGIIYFWADMTRGAFARERLLEASLTTALLYLWMKCWHAVFASKLRAHLMLTEEEPWTVGRIFRLALIQTAFQPAGLFLRILAAQVIIPYVWTYSFFQNITVLGDGTQPGFGEVFREATKQAGLWLRQAHLALTFLFGFAFIVWLNICVVIGFLPALLKTLFGIETVFSRDLMAMVNTTTFTATLAATYLCFDPLRKAVYVLRCFHGTSLLTGEDLRVELKTLQRSRSLAAMATILVAGLLAFSPVAAAEDAAPPKTPVESTQLNDSLDHVLQKREYAWRLPREEAAADNGDHGLIATFFEELVKQIQHTVRVVVKWMGKVGEWLRQMFDRPPKEHDSSEGTKIDWLHTARWTLVVLVVALLVALAFLLRRWLRNPRQKVDVAEAVAAVPDLNKEDVTADQLPEDGWLRLARDLIDQGELRLAVRAFYLAGLAHLGQRELIHIARHKSNLDYDRELQRRARGQGELLTAFGDNLLAFERVWYGEHGVTQETLGGFSQNLERIRAC